MNPNARRSSVFAVIGICPVNSQGMVCEDITGTCRAGDFVSNVLGQTEVCYALREAKRLGALMWTETVLVRTTRSVRIRFPHQYHRVLARVSRHDRALA